MKIYSVNDKEFKPYGKVVEGFPVEELLNGLAKTPVPEGRAYVPSEPLLEETSAAAGVSENLYGGMPVQLGCCNGHNTRLNCLEYHRSSEFNLGTRDFILLLAKQDEIEDGVLDTAKVKAFRVPAGTLIEVYATTLHFAPCHTDPVKGFQVMVALPEGTNTAKPGLTECTEDDRLLWARNKWLLAHPESDQAFQGAYVGLRGENIDIAKEI